MKVYIAGKITGDPNYKAKFGRAKSELEKQGNIVLDPAILPEGMTPADYMRICFAMIDCADVVAFLPDYKESRGAWVEDMYCQYVSKAVTFLPEHSKEEETK